MSPKWPDEIYIERSIQDLILAAFHPFDEKGVSFEQLLTECFNLFPAKFCFDHHPDWPDARKLGRPLRSLRRQGLIQGRPGKGFSLSGKGKKKANEITAGLRQRRLEME